MSQHPSWSPDGTKIVYMRADIPLKGASLWVMNADGGGQRKLTRPTFEDVDPDWMPGG